MQNHFELLGETPVELHDMGDGCLVLGAVSETGTIERVALEWEQLEQAVEALRPRYGTAKNTERGAEQALAVLGL